uniref:Secreted protein n=1 Tax=Ascaris lumbricoides TaxID=6252 RepID=A0A0M3ICM9_ASCLU
MMSYPRLKNVPLLCFQWFFFLFCMPCCGMNVMFSESCSKLPIFTSGGFYLYGILPFNKGSLLTKDPLPFGYLFLELLTASLLLLSALLPHVF